MATLQKTDDCEEHQQITIKNTYTLDTLFNLIKVNSMYPYMYYKGMYKLDMSSKINPELIEPNSLGKLEMFIPTRINVRIYDTDAFSLYGNSFVMKGDNLPPWPWPQNDVKITVSQEGKRDDTFDSLNIKKLEKYNLADSEWNRQTENQMTWNGIMSNGLSPLGYGRSVTVTVMKGKTHLLEYTLKDVFNQKCISIQLGSTKNINVPPALIYDKNYHDSLYNKKFVYTNPSLVYYGSTQTDLYRFLVSQNIYNTTPSSVIMTSKKTVYDVSLGVGPVTFIQQHKWLDACLNDRVFNKHILIDDFTKINENVINMKMKISDKAIITFLPITQQFRMMIETSGERVGDLENNMRNALIEMINQYVQNEKDNQYDIYDRILEPVDEEKTDGQWNWWETDKGRYGKLNKKGEPVMYNPASGKRKPPKWYDQVYLTEEGYSGRGSGGCPTKNRPVAVDQDRYNSLLTTDKSTSVAEISVNSQGESLHNPIYVSCTECDIKTPEECGESPECKLTDGQCSNIFSRMQGPHHSELLETGDSNPLYREKYCCSKSAEEGGRVRNRAATVEETPVGVAKSTTTIDDSKRYEIPIQIAQFLKGGGFYRQQSTSIQSLGPRVRQSLFISLWGDIDVFTKLSERLGRTSSIYDMYNICRQENYDLTLSQFEYVMNYKYINPRRFIRLVEFIEDVNVIIFTRQNNDITIAIPNHANEYVWNNSSVKQTLVIYEHYGSSNNEKILRESSGYPFCQIIYNTEGEYTLNNIDLSALHKNYTTITTDLSRINNNDQYAQCFDGDGKTHIIQYTDDTNNVYNMFLKKPIQPLILKSVPFENCIDNTGKRPPADEIRGLSFTTPCPSNKACGVRSPPKEIFYKTQKVAKILPELVKYKLSSTCSCDESKKVTFPGMKKCVRALIEPSVLDYSKSVVEGEPGIDDVEAIYNKLSPNIEETLENLSLTDTIRDNIKLFGSDIDLVNRNLKFVIDKQIRDNSNGLDTYCTNIYFPNYFETAFDWIQQLNANEYLAPNANVFKYWVSVQNEL